MKYSHCMIRMGFLVLASLSFFGGCSDNPSSGDTNPLPDSNLRFSEHILPIFTSHCAPCHTEQSQNGVNLASYNNLMQSVGTQYDREIVVPGAPDESPLVDKIEPNPEFGSRMPQGGSLSSEQVRAIRTWIEEGAKNN